MELGKKYRIYRVLCWVASIIGGVIAVVVVIFMFASEGTQAANITRDALNDWAQWLAYVGFVLLLGAWWSSPNKEQRKIIRVRACFTKQAVEYLISINATFAYPTRWWPGQSVDDLLRVPTSYVILEREGALWIAERRTDRRLAKFVFTRKRWDLELVA